MPAFPALAACSEAPDIIKNPVPIIIIPTAILNRVDASLFARCLFNQNDATTVPRVMIKNGLRD